MGRATDETLTPKPRNATIQGVVVVPSVAPTMTPIACGRVTSPALTKPMTVRLAAVEDWIAAVNSTPDTIALKWPPTSLCRVRRSASPARPFKPSVRWWIPSRNRPSPPTSVTAAAVSMEGPPLLGLRHGPQYFAGTNRLPSIVAWSS